MKTAPGEAGVSVWFPTDGLTVHRSLSWHASDTFVARRGQTLVVTAEIREANTDRLGRCVFDLTADEQVQTFGAVKFLIGERPDDFEVLEPGSLEWADAHARALADAHAHNDEDEKRQALARVRERFGRPSTSRTLATYTP